MEEKNMALLQQSVQLQLKRDAGKFEPVESVEKAFKAFRSINAYMFEGCSERRGRTMNDVIESIESSAEIAKDDIARFDRLGMPNSAQASMGAYQAYEHVLVLLRRLDKK